MWQYSIKEINTPQYVIFNAGMILDAVNYTRSFKYERIPPMIEAAIQRLLIDFLSGNTGIQGRKGR